MNKVEKLKFASYKELKGNLLKDGHTMFLQDAALELNRKSFLESNRVKLDGRIGYLQDKCSSQQDIISRLKSELALTKLKHKEEINKLIDRNVTAELDDHNE